MSCWRTAAGHQLSKLFKTSVSLHTLVAAGNYLGDRGIAPLCSALCHIQPVRVVSLDISSNGETWPRLLERSPGSDSVPRSFWIFARTMTQDVEFFFVYDVVQFFATRDVAIPDRVCSIYEVEVTGGGHRVIA